MLKHILSIAFIIALLVGKTILFKYSDKKSNEKIKEYEKPIVIESESNKYIKILVTEGIFSLRDSKEKMKVQINNNTNNKINHLKGFVSIYKDNSRVRKIFFEIKNLHKNYNEIIYFDYIKDIERYWNGFDVYVEQITANGVTESDICIPGDFFLRTHYMILNLERFYIFKFLGIRTKYNLAWLKEELLYKAVPIIASLHSKKVHSFKDMLKSIIRFILVVLVGLLLVVLIAFAILDIVKMIISIAVIGKVYISQIYNAYKTAS